LHFHQLTHAQPPLSEELVDVVVFGVEQMGVGVVEVFEFLCVVEDFGKVF